MRSLPLDFAGVKIQGEGFSRFTPLEATANEAHRLIGGGKVARIARVMTPKLLGGPGAKCPDLFIISGNNNIAVMNHLLGPANAGIFAGNPAGGSFKRDELALKDCKEEFAGGDWARAAGRKAGKIKGGIVQFTLRKVLMPKPKPVEAVASQNATIEIATLISNKPLNFRHRRGNPADPLRWTDCGI